MVGSVITFDEGKPVANALIIFDKGNLVTESDSLGNFIIQLPATEIPEVRHIAYECIGVGLNFNVDSLNTKGNDSIILYMQSKATIFAPIEITALRVDANAPVTYTNISGKTLNQNNFGEDMPFLLDAAPSTVVTSDAGNGIGYTGLRIRGSDATRVNITINGVPYNDAESQQTYWVDLPDFATNVDDIQIQRGVGTSTNGVSSFGGAVNINTNVLNPKPFITLSGNIGSFNLNKKSLAFGTGLINNHWTFEGRYSAIYADGYIDRSYADLNAFFLTGAYTGKKYSSIVNIFSGVEHTFQSWGGVPAEVIDTNRTYNPYTYENQTDNYIQTHYQWHQKFNINSANKLRLTLNYTNGSGYYEQYETAQTFADYGVLPVVIGTDTIVQTDLITQKWLSNYYAGLFLQYEHLINSRSRLNIGGAAYRYSGDHFGKIIWSQFASTLGDNYEWYRNNSIKNDANIFSQYIYENKSISVLGDLQVRAVGYNFDGYDQYGDVVEQTVNDFFFNPKAGITFLHNNYFQTYVFAGISSKEPNRDDYIESSPLSRPVAEKLYNLEVGERIKKQGWQIMANYYLMYYTNQLVLTGQINDVGAYTRTNIPTSYRTGIELAIGKTFFNLIKWDANFTYSKNIIPTYTAYLDNWDTGEQTEFEFLNTPISFSPEIIAYNNFKFTLFNFSTLQWKHHALFVNFTSKYVGKQFIDNTGSDERALDAYLLHDVGLKYSFDGPRVEGIDFNLNFQNIGNLLYESNAWVYSYVYENTPSQLVGYYPQAGVNWNAGLALHF